MPLWNEPVPITLISHAHDALGGVGQKLMACGDVLAGPAEQLPQGGVGPRLEQAGLSRRPASILVSESLIQAAGKKIGTYHITKSAAAQK